MRGLSIILFCFANVAFAGDETNSLEYIVRSGDTLWVIDRTYLSDKNGEPLGARWYDVWVTLDGKIIRRGKLKTAEEVVAE